MQSVNTNNFDQEVKQSKIPCMVKFTASWCQPCLRLQPILEEVAQELDGKVKIVSIDVDDNPELSSTYKVKSIPTMLLFKDGQLVKTQVGSTNKSNLIKMFDLDK